MTEQEEWDDGFEGSSKSQIKRDMLALQALGSQLLDMKPKDWEQFPLGDTVLAALQESIRIKEKTARKRHKRRLGKLLRGEDLETINMLFERLDHQQQESNQRYHRLEKWRDRLILGGQGEITEFLEQTPNADRQHLNQLLRLVKKENDLNKPPAASRKLFKYLRELEME